MPFRNNPQDYLQLGANNAARIILDGNEARIVLYNEFGTPIMEFDGTSEFEGETFSRILIRNFEGDTKVQIDQFQLFVRGNTDASIRMVAGELPGQLPRLEIIPPPLTEGAFTAGPAEVRGESDDSTNGGSLTLESPHFGSFDPAVIEMYSEDSSSSIPRVVVTGSLEVPQRIVVNDRPAKLLVDAQQVRCNSTLVISTTSTLISGTQVNFDTTVANALVTVIAIVDYSCTAFTSSSTAFTELYVDGVAEPAQVVFTPTAVGQRMSASQTYDLIVATPGSHTVELRGDKTNNNATIQANQNHTGLNVKVFE